MGKHKFKRFGLFLTLASFLGLTSCGSFESSELTLDNVRYAYDSVLSTFGNMQYGAEESDPSIAYLFTDIFNLYNSNDVVGSRPSDLKTSNEPFVEFRYLNGILQQNPSFVLNKIYYDEQNVGTVNFNSSTGEKDSTYLGYSCVVGATVRTTHSGIINADIAFYNTYGTTASSAFTTTKYVNVMLNYNFDHSEPTFSLKLFTRNDEKLAPYVGYITYQYDYFVVTDGVLLEWRSFAIESSAELLIDESHMSFDDYVKAKDYAYRVDAPKWFVGGKYYKIKNMTKDKQISVGNTLFGTGLFEPYTALTFEQRLQEPDVLVKYSTGKVYTAVSRACGVDNLEYVFLAKRDSNVAYINYENNPNIGNSGVDPNALPPVIPDYEDKTPVKVNFYEHATRNPADSYRYDVANITIKDIFTGFYCSSKGANVSLDGYYINSFGQAFEQIATSDLTSNAGIFSFKVSLDIPNNGGRYGPKAFSLNDNIAYIYQEMDYAYGISSSSITNTFTLDVKNEQKNVSGQIRLSYTGDLSFLDEVIPTPQQLLDYGVPEWNGQFTTSFEPMLNIETGYEYRVYSRNIAEDVSSYMTKLYSEGFMLINQSTSGQGGGTYIYGKLIDDDTKLRIVLKYPTSTSSYVTLKTYQFMNLDTGMVSNLFPNAIESLGVPAFTEGYYNNPQPEYRYDSSLLPSYLFINGASPIQLRDYYSLLGSKGFTCTENRQMSDEYKKIDGQYIIVLNIYYFDSLEKDYIMTVERENNPDYTEDLQIDSFFVMFNFGPFDSTTVSSNQKFNSTGPNSFKWDGGAMPAGRTFKIIANKDWSVKNPGSSYDGFGYDDFSNITNYPTLFGRGDDGEVVVLQSCIIYSISVTFSDKATFEISAQYTQLF